MVVVKIANVDPVTTRVISIATQGPQGSSSLAASNAAIASNAANTSMAVEANVTSLHANVIAMHNNIINLGIINLDGGTATSIPTSLFIDGGSA
jgi:hypothetical protein